ncbi:cell division protein FtsQ/DivIB [Gudongella sp. DL1XJH-153]|uniref:cell division protein FtsQ/DivIB n=1 Tax=Gudongella sp. DL1XJH-153 TaxID=3409804 RepID=UPI003BB5A396
MVKETRVQRKNRKVRIYRRIVVLILVLSLLIFWSLRTKLLQIKAIQVDGNSKITTEEIVEVSEIGHGDSIIKTKVGKAEESIVQLPYIDTVEIKRKFPGTIEILVQERVPYMQFEYNYSYAVIDSQAVLLEYSIRRNSDIPLVKGFDWEQLKPGEEVLNNGIGNKLQDMFNDEEMEKIVLNFREIVYDEENNIKINLFNGVIVEFGPLHNVKYKLKVLQEIIEDVEEKNIPTKMIIMNKGEHPIVVRDER